MRNILKEGGMKTQGTVTRLCIAQVTETTVFDWGLNLYKS